MKNETTKTINDLTNIPAAACPRCGGWTSFGGCSQFAKSKTPVNGRTGCYCVGGNLPATLVCCGSANGFHLSNCEVELTAAARSGGPTLADLQKLSDEHPEPALPVIYPSIDGAEPDCPNCRHYNAMLFARHGFDYDNNVSIEVLSCRDCGFEGRRATRKEINAREDHLKATNEANRVATVHKLTDRKEKAFAAVMEGVRNYSGTAGLSNFTVRSFAELLLTNEAVEAEFDRYIRTARKLDQYS